MAWQDEVKKYAPILGGLLTVAGGPAGALAGAALTGISQALGVPNDPTAIQNAIIAGLSPDQQAALQAADLDYKKAVLATGIQEKQIDADTEKAYITDVADARAHNAQTMGILVLGYLVNLLSYCTIAGILYGVFTITKSDGLNKIDPGTLAAVSTLLGGMVQWIMSNAGQANGFFFGSSPMARQNAGTVTSSITTAVKNLTK